MCQCQNPANRTWCRKCTKERSKLQKKCPIGQCSIYGGHIKGKYQILDRSWNQDELKLKKTRNQISNESFQVVDLDFPVVENSISGSCRYYQDLGYMQLSMPLNRLLDQIFVQNMRHCVISGVLNVLDNWVFLVFGYECTYQFYVSPEAWRTGLRWVWVINDIASFQKP